MLTRKLRSCSKQAGGGEVVSFSAYLTSYGQYLSVLAQEGSSSGITFSTDGTQLYMVGTGVDTVFQYSLSTAFDLNTASLLQSKSVLAQEANPQGLFFKPDGTKMYIIGSSGDDVNEYSLGTGWDISTASYVQNFSVAAQDTNPRDLCFSSDGLRLFVVGSTNDNLCQYSLSSAWDVSTASYDTSFYVGTVETTPIGICTSNDGLSIYVLGVTSDSVVRFPLTTAWDITSRREPLSVTLSPVSDNGLCFKPDGTTLYGVFRDTGDIYEYDLSVPWDVSTFTYVRGLSVLAEDSYPVKVFFKPDGTKMYVLGDALNAMYEYDLATAWNISTASFLQSFSVGAQESLLQGGAFSADGTSMYILGISNDAVFQYTLSTAWDVSTASYLQSFSVAAQDTAPRDLYFNPDGLSMYVIGDTRKVFQYILTAAWDVSTASYSGNNFWYLISNVTTGTPRGINFSPTGDHMYISSTTDVYQYSA